MPAIFLYILKLSVSLAILWLFYIAVLRRLTFHAWNRCYLLGYSLLSFFIPLIDIGPILSDPSHPPIYFTLIPAIGNYTPATLHSFRPHPTLTPWNTALFLMAGGAILLLARTLIRWHSLSTVKRTARLISSTDVRIYQVDRDIKPFSFGRSIYINSRLHTEKEWEQIILHEYVHIRQRHTIDILLAEALTILNWYNPFTWAIRHSIRQNLEFIADQKVLDNGVDKKGYQYHLLKVLGNPQYHLANNFNFSSLKKRIAMMNKMRSARQHLLRFLFLLPLLTITLLAFRNRYPNLLYHSRGPVFVNVAGIVISLPEKTPLEGVTVRDKGTGLQTVTNSQGYYKLQIPSTADSANIWLEFVKQGYDSSNAGRFYPILKHSVGMIAVQAMLPIAGKMGGNFISIPNMNGNDTPVDPSYQDALADLHRVIDQNQQVNKFVSAQKAHPEIGLLYITEGKQEALAINTDGSVERFGYPGSPSLTDLDKKYGPLPWYYTDNAHPVGRGYLDRWAAIAAQAEKDFHPTGGNPKAIIFPGDSRVIAVSTDGKPQIFDMDNTRDPKERSAFEQLYGKLPPCVPISGTVPAVHAVSAINRPQKPETSASPTDSLPLAVAPYMVPKINGDPIIVVDGIRQADSVNALSRLDPNTIETVAVLKNNAAAAQYGPSGGNRGVILIKTKNTQKKP